MYQSLTAKTRKTDAATQRKKSTTQRIWLPVLLLLMLIGCGSDGSEELTLFVGPEITGCIDVGVRHCMQVQFDKDDEVELFPNPIVGFQFEPGFDYELRVRKTPIVDEMFDFEYELIEIVSKTESY